MALLFRDPLRNRCRVDLRTTAMLSETKHPPQKYTPRIKSPRDISSVDPVEHKCNTGSRTDDAGQPRAHRAVSRLQDTVTAAARQWEPPVLRFWSPFCALYPDDLLP